MGLRSLPITFPSVMGVFAPVFSRPGWQPVQGLMRGAILAPGQRTVTAMRQRMGRRAAPAWQTYHRGLHRAVGSPRKARRRLRRRLGAVFLPRGVVILGLEDTIERRRGAPIAAQGISRAPVRSSHAPVVNVRGLRWLACLGLTPLAGADRVWARPGLTGLGPSERCAGGRDARAPWSPTAVVRPWSCGTRSRRGPVPGCARVGVLTRRSRLPRPPVSRGPQTVPGSQGSVGRRWRRRGQRSGRQGPWCSWIRGMGTGHGRSKSPPPGERCPRTSATLNHSSLQIVLPYCPPMSLEDSIAKNCLSGIYSCKPP